jgi:phosphate transport system substrate-binding protein
VNTSSLRRLAVPAVAALTVGLTLSACGDSSTSGGGDGGSSGGASLNGGGSTAQAVAEQTWRANYQKQNGGTINYEEVGSGTGVENFISKAYDFAGSDAYLTSDQVAQAKAACGGDPIEVPAYISPLAVAFNLSGVKSLNLDGPTIAKIFNGTITTWDDPAIAQQNKGVSLPSTAISTVHRSDDSGTTFNFTDYLSKAGAWSADPSVTWPASIKGGQGLEGTSGVIGGLTDTDGAIGYADDSAVKSTDLGVVSVKVGSDYNPPTPEGAAKVAALSPIESGRAPSDMAIKVDRTSTQKGTYPLLLISYLMTCPTFSDSAKADAVKGYLTYVVSSDGQQAAAAAAGSAPLDSKLPSEATDIVSKISGS